MRFGAHWLHAIDFYVYLSHNDSNIALIPAFPYSDMKKKYIILLILAALIAIAYFWFTRDTREIKVLVFSKNDGLPA